MKTPCRIPEPLENHLAIVEEIVHAGFSVDSKGRSRPDVEGLTPLVFLCQIPQQLGEAAAPLAAKLIELGANPEAKNSGGMTAINIARSMGSTELVKLLTRASAGPKSRAKRPKSRD